MEANLRRSSDYQKYNANLPSWFHNKPPTFTKHCIEKLGLAKQIPASNISFVEEVNSTYFIVRSSDNNKGYKVFLTRDDSPYPHCECPAWKRSFLPCKHLLSVFENFEEFNWDSLPASYTSSPYFNLDYGVISEPQHGVHADDSLEIEENELNTPDIVIDKNVIIKELPQKKNAKRSTATACRELLNEIKSLTYLITDEEVLDQLKKDLSISLKKLEVSVPRNDGIIKLSNGTVRKENFFSKQRCRLPKARSRKVHASGRLGIKAEQSKIASIIRVQSSDIRAGSLRLRENLENQGKVFSLRENLETQGML